MNVEILASEHDVLGSHAQNDDGNASRLIDLFGENLRYVERLGWLRWDGTRWAPCDVGPVAECRVLSRALREQGRKIGGEPGKAIEAWGRQSGNAGRIDGAIRVARADPRVRVAVDDLDADPWLFNCSNGTLDLRTGELRAADRDDRITKVAGVPYAPEVRCPRFVQFLVEVMDGDAELVGYLLRFLGYCLTGVTREHALGVWHGPDGGNGKSTLLEVVAHVMGDYAGTVATDVLLATNGGQHPTGLMDLRGRRFVYAIESPEGRRFNEALIKQLTGGDRIKARAMRQDFVEFSPTHTLVLATNKRPVVREQGGSFWRRVQLVPWLVSFTGREDKTLSAALRDEAPGILALFVWAAGEWYRDGLRVPVKVVAAGADYRESMDMLGLFVAEHFEQDPAGWVNRAHVYQRFVAWARDGGEVVPTRAAFYRMLEERGWQRRKNVIEGFAGWRWATTTGAPNI